MRKIAICSLLLAGCFDWDLLSSNPIEPDLPVVTDGPTTEDLADAPVGDQADLPTADPLKRIFTATGPKKADQAIFGWGTSNLIAVGSKGGVVTTSNLQNFTATTVGSGDPDLFDVWLSADGSSSWIVGKAASFRWSANSWEKLATGLLGDLHAVFGSSVMLLAAGTADGLVFEFKSGTNTWQATGGAVFNATQNGMWGTGQTFWSVGSQCLYIENGLPSLKSCGLASPTDALESVWGVDADTVFAAGREGTGGVVMRWDASGKTWQKVNVAIAEKLTAVWVASKTDVWVGGETGALYRYTGTGSDAKKLTSAALGTENIRDMWGYDASHVFILTDQGNIYTTQ